ncbi:MAG: hypothetical protein J6Q97_05865, partial [Bacteroidaceae bacterium]|nr:hypothetical protein [Bacteroidaceae bacterium]
FAEILLAGTPGTEMLTWEKGIIGASVWGKNLLNKQYNTFYFRSMQNDFFAQGKPLQLGISININL